jgi:hypothetical protein
MAANDGDELCGAQERTGTSLFLFAKIDSAALKRSLRLKENLAAPPHHVRSHKPHLMAEKRNGRRSLRRPFQNPTKEQICSH